MASANFRLASQRVNPGEVSRMLNPVTVSAGARGRISAPSINTNASNLTFTPVQPPSVVYDTRADSAAKFAGAWANAAFKFQEEVAQVEADEVTLAIKRQHDETLAEYQQKMGQDALNSYEDFEAKAKQIAQPFLEQAEPN